MSKSAVVQMTKAMAGVGPFWHQCERHLPGYIDTEINPAIGSRGGQKLIQ